MLIGGLDVGTTGCKLTVYNTDGDFIHREYREYEVMRKNGAHEIDAEAVFQAVCGVIKASCDKYDGIEAIGVTTFGETFVALDSDDNILFPSMLYTDPRGYEETQELCGKLSEEKITRIAGVKPNQMYSIPKIMWIKKHYADSYKKIKHILLMQDFIVYMLTGKAQIDFSLAARTMGFDIRNKCWYKEIFDSAGIDIRLMSKPVQTGTKAGVIKEEMAKKLEIQNDIVIVNGCHDQVAAAVGAGVFDVGTAVDGMGTVECVTPVFDKIPDNARLYEEGYSVVPYIFDNTYVCYALSFTCGAAIKWYRDNFAKYETEQAKINGSNVYADLDNMIPQKPTDIFVLPHFAGAANPYMDNDARAAIIGLSLENTNYDIYKAFMEGTAYEIKVNLEHLENFGIRIDKLIAAGGGASSSIWLQIKSDILSKPVTALSADEAGACGTAMLTAVSIGAVKDILEAKELFVKEKLQIVPDETNALIYNKKYESYKKLYNTVKAIR